MEKKTEKNQLKRPLQKNCFKCPNSIEVKYNPGQGEYVKKNNWGYWTNNEKENGKYICDNCLIHLYKNERWEYLENITDDGKRRVLRTYIYDHTLTLT